MLTTSSVHVGSFFRNSLIVLLEIFSETWDYRNQTTEPDLVWNLETSKNSLPILTELV